MQRLMGRMLFVMQVVVLLMGMLGVPGQGAQLPDGYTRSEKLPEKFMALVPQGYVLDNQQWVKYGGTVTLSFVARKQFEGHHSLYSSEYHLELNIKESPSQLIKMQAPMYKKQLELNIEKKMSGRQNDDSDPITGYDKLVLTKYPWGAGITQRVIHKYMGAGTNPDEIEYRCEYLGLITDNQSIKQFSLSVSGEETQAIADKWAKQVAERIAKTGLGNISDK